MTDEPQVLELLAADHHRIGEELSGDAAADVIRDLSMHLYAEEEVLHPALRRHVANGDDLADDLLDVDHQLLDALAEAAEKGRSNRAEAVADLFARHRAAFEAAAAPARAQIEPEELARLGEVLLATLAEAPTHPHPHLPGARGPFKPLVDAAASTVDHLIDRLHGDDDETLES